MMKCCKPKVRATSIDLKNAKGPIAPKVQTQKMSGAKFAEKEKQQITVIPLDNTNDLFDQQEYV